MRLDEYSARMRDIGIERRREDGKNRRMGEAEMEGEEERGR